MRRGGGVLARVGLMGLALGASSCASLTRVSPRTSLRQALTFHASFDHGPEADFARGDRSLYRATSYDSRAAAHPEPAAGQATFLVAGQGRWGGALRCDGKTAGVLFYQGARNTAYNATNWSGTVSFWLQVDPEKDLEPGFCDPLQVTPRAWNDAALFVEFEKRQSTVFRLGVYADYRVWNPEDRRWEDIPASNKPLLQVNDPPFEEGKWTHVVVVFEGFNTGQPHGVARLYLDGQLAGSLAPRVQTFSWDERQSALMLGVGYTGLFDELSWFNRALTAPEIQFLYDLEDGVPSLLSR
jgi:hypothetical protein